MDSHADCHSSRPGIGVLLRALGRYAGRMTVRDMLTAFQVLPRDAELLAFEAGCEDYCERSRIARSTALGSVVSKSISLAHSGVTAMRAICL